MILEVVILIKELIHDNTDDKSIKIKKVDYYSIQEDGYINRIQHIE